MSSNRKRAALHKANQAKFYENQHRLLAEHHRDVWKDVAVNLAKRHDALQARIDELMLEYCPDEMTPEQLANYEKHQVPVANDVTPDMYAEIEGDCQVTATTPLPEDAPYLDVSEFVEGQRS